MTDTLRSDIESRAIEACRQTRDDAVLLLATINEGGETYFDRSDVAADVDERAFRLLPVGDQQNGHCTGGIRGSRFLKGQAERSARPDAARAPSPYMAEERLTPLMAWLGCLRCASARVLLTTGCSSRRRA